MFISTPLCNHYQVMKTNADFINDPSLTKYACNTFAIESNKRRVALRFEARTNTALIAWLIACLAWA